MNERSAPSRVNVNARLLDGLPVLVAAGCCFAGLVMMVAGGPEQMFGFLGGISLGLVLTGAAVSVADLLSRGKAR